MSGLPSGLHLRFSLICSPYLLLEKEPHENLLKAVDPSPRKGLPWMPQSIYEPSRILSNEAEVPVMCLLQGSVTFVLNEDFKHVRH